MGFNLLNSSVLTVDSQKRDNNMQKRQLSINRKMANIMNQNDCFKKE